MGDSLFGAVARQDGRGLQTNAFRHLRSSLSQLWSDYFDAPVFSCGLNAIAWISVEQVALREGLLTLQDIQQWLTLAATPVLGSACRALPGSL